MKILMSALGCEPDKGSELEVGYRAMLAAARCHDVWVLTSKDSIPAIRAAISGTEAEERIHLEGIESGLDEQALARLTVPGFHWYYDRWQRRAATRALELERRIDFDVVHHVTLASYWTRAGVTVVDKPLVWGPVGGGVETPWRLIPELGLRGLVEDLGRVVIRRPIGRMGPARRPQQKANVIFAQNKATAARLKGCKEVVILTNAVSIGLEQVRSAGHRTKDIYVVGRLVPWKAPILAVRAMRYVQETDCVLHICGEGPERQRLESAARQWGVRDRVSFDGWLRRDVLLERIASAGALVHPSLHEEAGLCVAEALAMGTPVVCLNRGGPPGILAEWPDTKGVAVEPANPQSTARAMAAAVDDFLRHPPDIRKSPLPPRSSFEEELLHAYDRAVGTASVGKHRLRPVVWGFPRGKPQVFANSPKAVGSGIAVYAFGRQVPAPAQAAAVMQMAIPGLRSLLAERLDKPDPVSGWKEWDSILEQAGRITKHAPEEWLYFRSQWAKKRSSALALDHQRTPLFLVVVEPKGRASVHPDFSSEAFRVPSCLDSFEYDGWQVRVIEPLPRYHRAARWDRARIGQVVEQIPKALEGLVPRPVDAPGHWTPLHGDFVPWNLREDRAGQLWLVDWEDAVWGPPLADAVRYFVAYRSLTGASPPATAMRTRQIFRADAVDLQEVAKFWLQHRNLQGVSSQRDLPRRKAREAARGAREITSFSILAREDLEECGRVPARDRVLHRGMRRR